jgi:hypothetical protein
VTKQKCLLSAASCQTFDSPEADSKIHFQQVTIHLSRGRAVLRFWPRRRGGIRWPVLLPHSVVSHAETVNHTAHIIKCRPGCGGGGGGGDYLESLSTFFEKAKQTKAKKCFGQKLMQCHRLHGQKIEHNNLWGEWHSAYTSHRRQWLAGGHCQAHGHRSQ